MGIDVQERLAPFIEALSFGDEPELAIVPMVVVDQATPYQPRHLAT